MSPAVRTSASRFARSLRCHRDGGFSLVELVMVIAIMTITAAVAVPRLSNSLSRFRVQAAAERIAADMAYAQQRARQRSASQQLVFNAGANAYSLPGIPDLKNPAQNYAVALADSPYLARIQSAIFNGTPILEFDGYGAPRFGGAVIIQSGPHTRTVTLDQNSGKAVIQ